MVKKNKMPEKTWNFFFTLGWEEGGEMEKMIIYCVYCLDFKINLSDLNKFKRIVKQKLKIQIEVVGYLKLEFFV